MISDIIDHWYEIWNTIVFANSFCAGLCALMFIISNHYGIKYLSNLQQLESCNIMYKGISYIMVHLYDLWNTIEFPIHIYNGKNIICALMFAISYHYGTKCLCNLLQLEPCNDMLKVISDIWNIGWFVKYHCDCNAKKIICAFMLIINNH